MMTLAVFRAVELGTGECPEILLLQNLLILGRSKG